MTPANPKRAVVAMMVATLLGGASTASAQSATDTPWSVDVGIGFDNGISGHINASGVGTLNDQVTVITKNSYEDVYGTGLHLKFGGGYLFKPNTEARVTFTFQSLDADFIVPMGDYGSSNLYGQYTDYQAFGIDFGLRQYATLRPRLRAYGEGTIGIGFVDKTDVTLIAPGAGLVGEANDFYDQTTAFSFGAAGGLMVQTSAKTDVFVQLGLRWVSGMAEIDDLVGTGLDNINDKSSRWTLPFVGGVRLRF